jgi:hypothetical protein
MEHSEGGSSGFAASGVVASLTIDQSTDTSFAGSITGDGALWREHVRAKTVHEREGRFTRSRRQIRQSLTTVFRLRLCARFDHCRPSADNLQADVE